MAGGIKKGARKMDRWTYCGGCGEPVCACDDKKKDMEATKKQDLDGKIEEILRRHALFLDYKEAEKAIKKLIESETRKDKIYINHLHAVDGLLDDIVCDKCSDNFFNGTEPRRCMSCEIATLKELEAQADKKFMWCNEELTKLKAERVVDAETIVELGLELKRKDDCLEKIEKLLTIEPVMCKDILAIQQLIKLAKEGLK